MISGKKILVAGVGLLLLYAPAGAEGLLGLPGIDRRATRIRHLHLPYSFEPFLIQEGWLRRAGYLRRQIEVSAGLWPPVEKSPLKARIFGRVSKGDYSIEKVFFESYPGFYVTGNLYRPLGKEGPLPGYPDPPWPLGLRAAGESIPLLGSGPLDQPGPPGPRGLCLRHAGLQRQPPGQGPPPSPGPELQLVGHRLVGDSALEQHSLGGFPAVPTRRGPRPAGLHRGFGRGHPDLSC